MRISSTTLLSVLLLSAGSSTMAWVTTPLQQASRRFSSSSPSSSWMKQQQPQQLLYSTLEKTSSDEVTSSSTVLQPAYAKALEQLQAVLQSSIPETYAGTMLPLLQHFATEYMTAHCAAAAAGNTVHTDPESAAARFLEGIQYGLKYGMPFSPDHYTFDVSHTALRGGDEAVYEGVDFYQVGCDFFRSCMDLASVETNVLGADTHLQRAMDQVAAGENVVFLANHQSEADPQVVSACLELAGFGPQAADMIYVAGHKVTTDPLAIPFSMGRNLICIHSKKHIDADPETKPVKQRQNLKAMNALLSSLKTGGACIWVAPSGGRDRRNVETGHVPIAPFDSKTIDMFRLMGNKSKVPTHYYTFAMVSYDLCPPPDTVDAGTGETRNVRFAPVGVAIGPELPNVGGLESRHAFCETAVAQCQADYERLLVSLQQQQKQQ